MNLGWIPSTKGLTPSYRPTSHSDFLDIVHVAATDHVQPPVMRTPNKADAICCLCVATAAQPGTSTFPVVVVFGMSELNAD